MASDSQFFPELSASYSVASDRDMSSDFIQASTYNIFDRFYSFGLSLLWAERNWDLEYFLTSE